jgi:hypothetical protein
MEKDWQEYTETLQQSTYMNRLNIDRRELDFKAGYEKAILKLENVNRFEVIDHSLTGEGREYVRKGLKEVVISLQDEGLTLKIFIG